MKKLSTADLTDMCYHVQLTVKPTRFLTSDACEILSCPTVKS